MVHHPTVPAEDDSGAIVLTQRFALAANLNDRLRRLGLGGVYRHGTGGEPVFVEVAAPSDEAMLAVLHKIITRMMRLVHEARRCDVPHDDVAGVHAMLTPLALQPQLNSRLTRICC